MKFLSSFILAFAMIFAVTLTTTHAEAAVTVIKSSHFEGGKNLSEGAKGSKSDKTLSALLSEQATAINTNITAIAANSAADAKLVKYTSTASVGGGATEAVVVTGLGATDTILAVSQRVKGANSLPLLGWQTQIAGGVTLVYSADPGAGAIVEIFVKKP